MNFAFQGSEAKLWWPNGYGNPTLYPYQVTYTSSMGDETSSKAFNVGFRIVELIQDPVDQSRPDFGIQDCCVTQKKIYLKFHFTFAIRQLLLF